MKWPVVALLISGIAAAFCASLLVASLGLGKSRNAKDTEEVRDIKVLVAKSDLDAPIVVTAEMFEAQTIKSDKAPFGSINEPVKVIGDVLTSDVKAGEALAKKHFAPDGAGKDLAARLPEGFRLMTVSLSNFASLEGLLYPGSIVDVIATFKLHQGQNGQESRALSTTLLEKVEVYDVAGEAVRAEAEEPKTTDTVKKAVAPNEDKKKVPAASTRKDRKVTLKVNSQQAEALQLAIEHGTITLVMRNPTDQKELPKDATVLNEGALAKLSEFLKANVDGQGNQPAQEGEALSVVPGPTTAVAVNSVFGDPAPTNPEWQVKVFRGVKSPETLTFPAPARAGQ